MKQSKQEECAELYFACTGAGKSWFAEALSKRRKVVIISQDESRSRSACESQLGASVKHAPLTILDRCDPFDSYSPLPPIPPTLRLSVVPALWKWVQK